MKLNTDRINLLNLVAYISLPLLLAFIALRVILIFSYSSDIGGIESNVIYSINKVLYGLPLYSDPENGNFDITQYAPFYYYLILAICKMFSLSPLNDLHTIYIIGRTVSLILNILGGLILFRLLTKVFLIDRRISFISCTVYFLYLTRLQFAARPDSLFNLVSILILYMMSSFLTSSDESKRRLLFIGGLLLAALSIFVKQSGIEYVVLIPLFFLLTGKYKDFFISGLFLLVVSGGVMWLFSVEYPVVFFKNVFGGLDNGSSISHGYKIFSDFYMRTSLIMAIGAIGGFLFLNRTRTAAERYVSFSILFLFAFALLTSMKLGSWISYYNEFIVASIIFAAIEITKWREYDFRANKFAGMALVLFSVYILILMPHLVTKTLHQEIYGPPPISAADFHKKQDFAREFKKLLDNDQKAYFLSFDEDINSMLAYRAVVPNKDIVPDRSSFNYAKYHSAFANGTVRYIVIPAGRSISSFLHEDFKSFHVRAQNDQFTILEFGVAASQ